MEYKIREMQKSEYGVLEDFLYEAIFIPEGVTPPERAILDTPELQVYVTDFGKQRGDVGLVAEVNHRIVGAVWARIMHDYGHVDDETPSLAISLYKEARGSGIGTAMMKEMLIKLRKMGFRQTSLAVQKENYAVSMYQKVGFEIVHENEEEYIMVRGLL